MDPIGRDEARELAETLPDDPFSFEARCALLRGHGDGWFARTPAGELVALVRDRWQPTEPRAFGDDPIEIWKLLREVPGWDCINCSEPLAPMLRDQISNELGLSTGIISDIYFVLLRPARPCLHPSVRLLSEDDLELVDAAPESLRPLGYDSSLAALSGGIVAGAIEDARLVATTSMTASSATYANLAAHTLEGWRNRGIGSAAAFLVARAAQARGLDPVWSAAESNLASQRVAGKVGFEEYGRRAYVVVPDLRSTGGYHPPVVRQGQP